ncbi:glycosyltransferase family 4 protein [Gilvibacter sp.]|uniref:glycosyltransferase family 4 protein n=1 Tax=Gilvibacter sp. TaxID=2729997 RepID=UPI003B52E36C
MAKHICIVSNYYPPEMGAAANRIQILAESLQAKGMQVTVLCPLPNYPFGELFEGYPKTGPYTEQINGIRTVRLSTFATKSTKPWLRFKAMGAFAKSVSKQLRQQHPYDIVIIQCSPLLVGYHSLRTAKKLGLKAVINISDIWPLAAVELGAMRKGLIYAWMRKMEKFIYRHADAILGQSEEILTHVQKEGATAPLLLYRNFPRVSAASLCKTPVKDVKVVYAGLLGAAQGILELCKQIELPANWELHIYGQGNEQEAIASYLNANSKSIIYMGSLTKEELHGKLSDYHLALAPLKTRIYGSVPSKLFELPHFGLPVLYLGAGEGAQVVQQYKLGWSVSGSDWKAMNALLVQLDGDKSQWPRPEELQQTARENFVPEPQLERLVALLDQ